MKAAHAAPRCDRWSTVGDGGKLGCRSGRRVGSLLIVGQRARCSLRERAMGFETAHLTERAQRNGNVGGSVPHFQVKRVSGTGVVGEEAWWGGEGNHVNQTGGRGKKGETAGG